MFDPFETEFIYSSTILVCFNNPIGQKKIIMISIFEIILIYYNNKWRHRSTIRINILDYNDLFLIIKLHNFNFPISVVQYYNKDRYNLTYKKVYFVEIPNVKLYNTIFDDY